MDYSREIQESIQKLSGTFGVAMVNIYEVEVNSVNELERICIVSSVNPKINIDNIPARLMLDISDGDLGLPSVGSNVLLAISPILPPVIIKSTWLDKKVFTVGDQNLKFEDGKTTFNDGSFEGLVKVIELTDKLNILEKQFNDFKEALFKCLVPPINEPGNGALSAFQTKMTSELSSFCNDILQETTKDEIQNPNIIHGEKLEDG